MARRPTPRGQRPGPREPTAREWANAHLNLIKVTGADPDATIFELKKTIRRGGKTWSQRLCLNIHQLRAIARDHAKL